MDELTGWLFDLYDHPEDGVVLWLLGDDGLRHRLRQPFPVTFYAAGPPAKLRSLWRYLRDQPTAVSLSREERRELFSKAPLPVLAVQVENPARLSRLFQRVAQRFPDLVYYDADLPLALRYAAIHDTFSLARCRVSATPDGEVQQLSVLDSPWDVDPQPPDLRVMYLQPNSDPAQRLPAYLHIHCGGDQYHLPLEPTRPLLVNLAALLRRHDPDLLLTGWGDTWLLPYLLENAQQWDIPLPLNREPGRKPSRRPARTYFAYGQVIYRGPEVCLFGRWHIDAYNAVMFHDYRLEGVLEMARVTGLPTQRSARVSPGTGISSMQILTALRQGILVPWHKQQAENPKTAMDLLRADKGGLVYQPTVGLHRDVAEIDFISMYPSIMAHFNISPETVGEDRPNARLVPELGLPVDQEQPGLVPETLRPLLDKRIELKTRLAELDPLDSRCKRYEAQVSAYKWLLVTCFGYLGYKNARFGRIEAHEAVTAYGREALLRAKEVAEDLGFTVLHMYVDGLWVQKEGIRSAGDCQPLLDEILERTGLPISLEGIYRWIAFLPSRVDPRVPVANRYFGVFQNRSGARRRQKKLKLRGIEARRRDTPAWVRSVQIEMIEQLAQIQHPQQLSKRLPGVITRLQEHWQNLSARRVPLVELLVTQKLSRELEAYRVPSPVARAAAQLARVGKQTRPGQYIQFVYTIGEPGVHAWNLPQPPNPASVDVAQYRKLLLRAASTVLGPFGVQEDRLRDWLFSNAGYSAPPGRLPPNPTPIPIFSLPAKRDQPSLATKSG